VVILTMRACSLQALEGKLVQVRRTRQNYFAIRPYFA
jgi:hypothetical protein